MKIELGLTSSFQPIVITLETIEEATALHSALDYGCDYEPDIRTTVRHNILAAIALHSPEARDRSIDNDFETIKQPTAEADTVDHTCPWHKYILNPEGL